MSRHIGWIFFLLHVAGCACSMEDSDTMGNIQRSATIDLVTTTSTTGPTTGDFLSSIQESQMPPGEYTIAFSVLPPGGTEVAVATQALINWKVDGQPTQRLISVTNGTLITGVANAVDVKVRDVSSLMGINQTAGRPYKVSAALTSGARPTINQPPYLVPRPAATLAPAGSVDIQVPKDSGVISVYVQVTSLNVLDCQVLQTVTGSLAATTQFNPQAPGGWVPLFPGADVIHVSNVSAINSLVATVFFGIAG